jgi:hypothetical protein
MMNLVAVRFRSCCMRKLNGDRCKRAASSVRNIQLDSSHLRTGRGSRTSHRWARSAAQRLFAIVHCAASDLGSSPEHAANFSRARRQQLLSPITSGGFFGNNRLSPQWFWGSPASRAFVSGPILQLFPPPPPHPPPAPAPAPAPAPPHYRALHLCISSSAHTLQTPATLSLWGVASSIVWAPGSA